MQRLLSESTEATVEPEVLDEIRRLLASLRTAWSSDFELPAWLARLIEGDRKQYLEGGDAFGALPDGSADRGHLVRRIHHQRLALRAFQRRMENAWRWRWQEWKTQEAWLERQLLITDEPCDEVVDVANLRKRLRLQTEARRRAERIIERQQNELCELLDRVVRQAATG